MESALKSCVSVSSLMGIRFRIRISSGRISWLMALSSSIIKMFSDSNIALAGSSFCTFIGITVSPFKCCFYHNCSVPSQLRAKIHLKSAPPMGFLLSSPGYFTVSAANAQTYRTAIFYHTILRAFLLFGTAPCHRSAQRPTAQSVSENCFPSGSKLQAAVLQHSQELLFRNDRYA